MKKRAIKCGLLSSFTLDRLADLASRRLETSPVEAQWHVAEFNQYPQEILNAGSGLCQFAPEVIFIAVAIEDLMAGAPSIWTDARGRSEHFRARLSELLGLVRTLSARAPRAQIFVNTFVPLEPQAMPILTSRSSASPYRLALQGNFELSQLCDDLQNVHLMPTEEALANCRLRRALDPRFYYLAKMRLGPEAMEGLAEAYAARIAAFAGLRKKCIVLDLDNTMWGGVLGEEGVEGIRLSDDGAGKAYHDFQRALLDYYETGTLLAICSKNDEALALAALREHPAMILRPEHFAAIRINWNSKAANLHELANELNIGMDAMVFLDDSEFERAEVQRLAPLVTVPKLPADPSEFPAFVASLPFFDSLKATEDDRRRSVMYADERHRKEFQHQAASLDEFLQGLHINISVRPADKFGLARLAQLSQKTNQFNLTTRRYSEGDLAERLDRGNWRVYSLGAGDRFGDSGVTGGCFAEIAPGGGQARIDSFFVSCRVLGRGIEAAFMTTVLKCLRREGVRVVEAEFIATEKNGVAKEFLPKQGFAQAADQAWRLDLSAIAAPPAWIKITEPEPVPAGAST
jgi:FkbH-like protein